MFILPWLLCEQSAILYHFDCSHWTPTLPKQTQTEADHRFGRPGTQTRTPTLTRVKLSDSWHWVQNSWVQSPVTSSLNLRGSSWRPGVTMVSEGLRLSPSMSFLFQSSHWWKPKGLISTVSPWWWWSSRRYAQWWQSLPVLTSVRRTLPWWRSSFSRSSWHGVVTGWRCIYMTTTPMMHSDVRARYLPCPTCPTWGFYTAWIKCLSATYSAVN